jgi:hypothetical protein
MKWTEELDQKLIEFIESGKRHNEIGLLFNTTTKSIESRCYRLKIKIKYYEEIECLSCKIKFTKLISGLQKFCSSECSGYYNSKGRKHTEESNNKTRSKLIGVKRNEEIKAKLRGENNSNWKGGHSIETRTIYRIIDNQKFRKCKYCLNFKINTSEKRKTMVCDECRVDYYKFYKPSCNFDFNLNIYPDKFNFDLIRELGWYSPSNKGNNLNGVSRDHMYSVKDGFINKVDYNIIKHPANCKIMKHVDNSSKNYRSSITLDELLKRIEEWDK